MVNYGVGRGGWLPYNLTYHVSIKENFLVILLTESLVQSLPQSEWQRSDDNGRMRTLSIRSNDFL